MSCQKINLTLAFFIPQTAEIIWYGRAGTVEMKSVPWRSQQLLQLRPSLVLI